MKPERLFLGIDIGGSSIKYGVGNSKQGLQSFCSIELVDKNLVGLQRVVAEIITEMEVDEREICAIGIGTPGIIDIHTGKIVGVNPNLPFWTDVEPVCALPSSLTIPAFSDNDANLMALAEAWQYPDAGFVMGVTVGSGIGSGYIQNGKIYHGSKGFAMELGHVCVVPGGAKCNCGKLGCLEAYSAVNGMKNRMLELGKDQNHLQLAELLNPEFTGTTGQAVVEAGIMYLALAVANAIILLDPDVVVFGGGASEIAAYPLQRLFTTIRSYLPDSTSNQIKLEKAHFGNKAGVFGAILLTESLFDETWEQ